jgi:hypothetical protein
VAEAAPADVFNNFKELEVVVIDRLHPVTERLPGADNQSRALRLSI